MGNNYRVHYRKGDIEIEVESTDKDYVDQMLAKLLASHPVTVAEPKPRRSSHNSTKKSASTEAESPEAVKVDVAGIVARIQDADNFADIEKNILNKPAQLPRVLLVSQYADDNGHDSITTGDIEAITDQLGMKITQPNASKCVGKNRKYFTAGSVRKKGAKVPYKINRQGKIALEKLIAGEKL